MTEKLVNLSEKRASREGDCRLWDPVDALRACLRDIENGEIKPDILYIAMALRDTKKNTIDYAFLAAGGTKLELLGLLYRHLAKTESSGEVDD